MSDHVILLLTHSEDFYTIDRVAEALKLLGANPIRINTDLYPEKFPLDIYMNSSSHKLEWEVDGHKFTSDQVKGVWYRRIFSPKIDNDIDPAFRNICVREAGAIFKFMFPLLTHAVWMDPFEVVENASNKLLQLHVAAKSGFTVPDTLVSNHAESARSFFKNQTGGVVTKLTMPTAYSMGYTSMALRTHRVEEEDLDNMDSLKYCPMMFQNEIDKAIELRIVYVDGHFFTGAIDASTTENGQVDWRRSGPNEASWQPYDIPEHLQTTITKFMNELKLTFGALDVIKTPSGEYVFLEVNPVGEWGMLEKELDYPISQQIALSLFNRIN